MKLKILALAVCIICSINLIGQEQFDRLYRTSDRTMTSLDMVEQDGGGTYFLLSKYYEETSRDSVHGLNVTSLDKKGSVTWSRDYIFYEDSSTVETVGSIVITEDGLMINTVVVDTLAELSNVVVGTDMSGIMQYARAYGSNSEDALVVGNAILLNAVDPNEVFHFGNTMTADGVGIYASKIDIEGSLVWAADLHAKDTLDNSFEESVADVGINYDSSYLTIGSLDEESIFLLNHDENGGQIYSRSYETFGNFSAEASAIATMEDSTVVISAYITNNQGKTTGGLIKLDTLGNIIWGKEVTASLGLAAITINDVVSAGDGQVAIAGHIERPDFNGAFDDGEFIIVLDSIGAVVTLSQYQIIRGQGSLRSGSLTKTEDGGYAYQTTAFDNEGGVDSSLIMRMIKVDDMANLGLLLDGENCNTPLEGLLVNDLAFRQDTLVWDATAVAGGPDTIEVFDFSYNHQAPILTLQDSMFCPGDPVMFEFDATTPGAVSYRWYDAEDEDMTLGVDSVFIGTEIDVDYVAVVKIEMDNCFTLCDTSRLTEIPPPMIQVGKGFGQICEETSQVTLIVDGAQGNTVEWSTGQTTPQIRVTDPDTYSVTVTNDCDDSVESSITVTEDDFYQPGAGVVSADLENCSGGVIAVTVVTTGDVSRLSWNTGSTANTIAVSDAGVYTVTIIDICGEEAEASIEVTAAQIFSCSVSECIEGSTQSENGCLCWPNAFVPKPNVEFNNSFGPINTCANNISNYNLRIYNRWGEKVFESESVGTKWNGNRNGKRAPSEVYAFYVVYEVEDVTIKDKGNVTLIR